MNVFITGITGTLGTALAKLHHSGGDRVWGCARNEANVFKWTLANPGLAAVFLADARSLADAPSDCGRCLLSMKAEGDVVYHCAAMKHVDLCEKHPYEAVRQNVELTASVAGACESHGVACVLVSSDKACLPHGAYGASKLLAERCALARNAIVVRLGNLIGSSGSVFSLWRDRLAAGLSIQVTDPDMTRYFIPVDEAARFIVDVVRDGVNVPRNMKSARMGDVAEAICGNGGWCGKIEVVGARPGETRHQWLVAPGEPEKVFEDVILLGRGGNPSAGRSSETAQRWGVQELLKIAGVSA
jgi:FlaA1/EpsC-like NDP-sugar epimerase